MLSMADPAGALLFWPICAGGDQLNWLRSDYATNVSPAANERACAGRDARRSSADICLREQFRSAGAAGRSMWPGDRSSLRVEESLLDRVGGERAGGVVGRRGFLVSAEAASSSRPRRRSKSARAAWNR